MKVSKKILDEAKKKREEILKKAKERAEEIKGRGKEELKRLERTEKERIKKLAEAERERILSAERLQIKKDILAKKREIIDRVYKRVVEELKKLPKKEYRSFYKSLIMKNFITGTEKIMIALDDKKRLKGIGVELNREKGLKFPAEEYTEKIEGGLILVGERVDVNLSTDAILRELREKTEAEVVKILFHDIS